jgi:hypothetical protein
MADFRKILALIALAAVVLVGQTTRSVTLSVTAPSPVQNIQATVSGTPGQTKACYWVVANYVGGAVMSTPGVCLSNVPNTLSSSNKVILTWQAATGVNVTYDVLKTTTPAGPVPGASTALSTAQTTTTYTDQGGSLSPYTAASYVYPVASELIALNNRDFSPPQVTFGPWLVNISAIPGFDTTGALLNGTYSVSANLSLAQVNAGTTILAGATGRTLKVSHFFLQAKGGDTATCTDVRISDTAGSPVDVATVAVAGLTQNTVVTEATASNVTVGTFAPTALTAGAGLQVRKTGASCATATSFNVIVYYTINS